MNGGGAPTRDFGPILPSGEAVMPFSRTKKITESSGGLAQGCTFLSMELQALVKNSEVVGGIKGHGELNDRGSVMRAATAAGAS